MSSSMSGLVQLENRIRGVVLLEPKRDGEVVEAREPWDAGRRMLEVCKDGEASEGAPFCFCPGTGDAMFCRFPRLLLFCRFKNIAFPGCCCFVAASESSEAASMSCPRDGCQSNDWCSLFRSLYISPTALLSEGSNISN